jgi:hypothetical protein
LIRFGDTPWAFVGGAAGCDRQLDVIAYRQSVARQYDWQVQIATLRTVLDEAAAARDGSRLPPGVLLELGALAGISGVYLALGGGGE